LNSSSVSFCFTHLFPFFSSAEYFPILYTARKAEARVYLLQCSCIACLTGLSLKYINGDGSMKQLEQTEKTLSDLFKGLPALPKNTKSSIVNVMPWIALVFGVLQVIVAVGVWQIADRAADFVNTYSAFYAVPAAHISAFDRTVIYLGAIVLLVDGVIGIMAYKALAARERRGWDLMFLAALVNLAYAVLSIFIDGRGFGSFLLSLLGSAVGFYLLFQIQGSYTKKSSVTP
jgi:hypothetical protein